MANQIQTKHQVNEVVNHGMELAQTQDVKQHLKQMEDRLDPRTTETNVLEKQESDRQYKASLSKATLPDGTKKWDFSEAVAREDKNETSIGAIILQLQTIQARTLIDYTTISFQQASVEKNQALSFANASSEAVLNTGDQQSKATLADASKEFTTGWISLGASVILGVTGISGAVKAAGTNTSKMCLEEVGKDIDVEAQEAVVSARAEFNAANGEMTALNAEKNALDQDVHAVQTEFQNAQEAKEQAELAALTEAQPAMATERDEAVRLANIRFKRASDAAVGLQPRVEAFTSTYDQKLAKATERLKNAKQGLETAKGNANVWRAQQVRDDVQKEVDEAKAANSPGIATAERKLIEADKELAEAKSLAEGTNNTIGKMKNAAAYWAKKVGWGISESCHHAMQAVHGLQILMTVGTSFSNSHYDTQKSVYQAGATRFEATKTLADAGNSNCGQNFNVMNEQRQNTQSHLDGGVIGSLRSAYEQMSQSRSRIFS